VNKILQFVWFKLCWLGLILVPAILVWPVLLYWFWSMWQLPIKARLAVISITIVGCVLDSLLLQSGVFSFVASDYLPFWMVLLWACFALVLVQVLADWLRHWLLAAVVGVVTGPLAYWAGALLGGQLVYSDIITMLLILAPCWALLLAAVVYYRWLWSDTNEAKNVQQQ
jgi:hypothetical protein